MKRAAFMAAAALLAAACRTSLQSAQPRLSLSAKRLDFGAVPVLNVKSLPLVLTDDGEAPLAVSSTTLTPADGPFAISGSPPATVQGGGGQATLTVTFTPPDEESYQGTLVLSTDDPTQPSVTVDLTGQGSTAGKLDVSPDPIDFGQVGEGNTGLQSLTLSSVGTAPLIVSSLSFGSGTDPAFSFAASTSIPDGGLVIPNVAPQNTVAIPLRFSPTSATAATAQGSVVIVSTDPSRPELSVPVTGERILAPICAIADPGTVAVGSLVTLDGSGSRDPGGNTPLTYAWTMTAKPAGSAAVLTNTDGPHPQLVADQAGGYGFSLDVTNALGVEDLSPCTATLSARPADDLYVEMIWDNLPVDMDLHFLGPGGTLDSPALDCNGNNQNPSGFAATCSDDHLTGPGPEWAEDANPAAGTYTIAVVYYSSHGVANPTTNVTVRVYEFGIVKAQLTQQLTTEKQVWEVATIDWPAGTVTPLGVVQGP